jgi:hypothetical protein
LSICAGFVAKAKEPREIFPAVFALKGKIGSVTAETSIADEAEKKAEQANSQQDEAAFCGEHHPEGQKPAQDYPDNQTKIKTHGRGW